MKSILAILISFILLTPISAQDQWEIVNEGFYFRDIDFINKDTGWISGENGLYKTIDGAESWELVNDQKTFVDIDFYDNNIGWAYEKGGSASNDPETGIFKTIDGGTSWYTITPPEGSGFSSVHCFNSEKGIVIGRDGIIYRTLNGGSSWYQYNQGLGHIGNIQITGESTAYFMAGGVIYKTTNTFISWSEIAIDAEYILNYHFFSRDTIIALRRDTSGYNCYIVKSINGGQTWKQVDHLKIPLPQRGDGSSLSAAENVAFFVFSIGSMNFILKSTDQGLNWKFLNLTFPMQDVHFMNRYNGFIAGSYDGYHISGGILLMTQNAGDTWEPVTISGSPYEKIHFVKNSQGYITISAGGTIFTTSDGGKNWITDESPSILDLQVLSDSVSWRMDYDSDHETVNILKTIDAGQSWETILKFSSSYGGYNSLFFKDEHTGFEVTERGVIIKFSDNGEWEKIESGTTLPLKKVSFTDELTGFITGGYSNSDDFQPIMLHTEDGGDHWTIGPYLPYLIHDLHFLNRLHGFAVGEDHERHGVLLETIDGGSSWNKVTLGKNPSGTIRALHYKDSICWAVGDNSLMLKYNPTATGINEDNMIISSNESLFQNYPNPFRTSTIISYQLSLTSHVELKVYDMLGRIVTTLLNETQSAGQHEMDWQAGNIQPGIYFCELRTRQGRRVIKMILSE